MTPWFSTVFWFASDVFFQVWNFWRYSLRLSVRIHLVAGSGYFPPPFGVLCCQRYRIKEYVFASFSVMCCAFVSQIFLSFSSIFTIPFLGFSTRPCVGCWLAYLVMLVVPSTSGFELYTLRDFCVEFYDDRVIPLSCTDTRSGCAACQRVEIAV